LVERANASSSVRSASVSMIGVASGMPCMHLESRLTVYE
jgi:hypothetical protein